jgi:hypothetical protein
MSRTSVLSMVLSTLRRRSPARRDLRKAGALDQVPAHNRQAAARQGYRRLRLQGHPDQRGPGTRPRRRRLHRSAAQRRTGRRDRHGQDASGDRHRAKLHQGRIARSLLHHRRSRQPARGPNPRRSSGPHRRLSNPPRLRHSRRTGLSSVRSGRRSASLPSRQPALRAIRRGERSTLVPVPGGPYSVQIWGPVSVIIDTQVVS